MNEIELKAPVPQGPPERSVRCTFAAKRLDLAFAEVGGTAEEAVASGELAAVIVASDCLWSVERDDKGAAVAVVSLRKAVPKVWEKLFAADADPESTPALLDGEVRSEPQTKAELLKQAKERIAKEIDGPSKARPFALEGLVDAQRTLTREELPELPVIIIRNCTGCSITLPAGLNVIKLQVEQSKKCTVDVRCRLLTELVEIWECEGCNVVLSTSARTVQLDKCREIDLAYLSVGFFDRIMHTGVRKSRVAFADAPSLVTSLDLDELQAERPGMTLSEETDQFITRRIGSDGGVSGGGAKPADAAAAAAGGGGAAAAAAAGESLTTELVIRLCNEFPTTEREVREFERRTRLHEEKLDEVVDGMLGSSLGRSLTEAEKEQMKQMMREQSAAASAAQQQAEQTAEGRTEARVTFKKTEGNAAFKAGNFQQAAVFYTEAMALDDTQHALYSNRAACFLKLGRYTQAHEDALKCTQLAPDFAKGHFRLALALQAVTKPAEAVAAFQRCLDLDPKNKEAAAGINMARMQAERQRRQQAGQAGVSID